jgi:alpha-ketoglutarate-dependent taurine dioxygenase
VVADGPLVSELVKKGPKWGKTNSYLIATSSFAPSDAAVLAQLSGKLSKQIVGHGARPLVIMEGVPLELPVASLLLLGQMYGVVNEFYEDGAAIDTVADLNRVDGLRPRSTNNLGFPMHTDLSFSSEMPQTVYFLMVNEAKEGGASMFCDMHDVLAQLSEETLAALSTPYVFPAPPHRPGKAPLQAPILEHHRSLAPSVRYRRDGLELLGSPAQRDRQSKALDEFEKVIEANTISMNLKRGELAIWRNRQMLHGREAFQDSPASTLESKRLALRTYATTV